MFIDLRALAIEMMLCRRPPELHPLIVAHNLKLALIDERIREGVEAIAEIKERIALLRADDEAFAIKMQAVLTEAKRVSDAYNKGIQNELLNQSPLRRPSV